MGNAQPKKLSKADLEKMGDTQFCNHMHGYIKTDTTYAFELNKFNELCKKNRTYLTNLYMNDQLSDMVLMDDLDPKGLSSIPRMDYTEYEKRILYEIKKWINNRIRNKKPVEVNIQNIDINCPLIKEECFEEDGKLALMKDRCNPLCEQKICINTSTDRMERLLHYIQDTSNKFYYQKGEKYYRVDEMDDDEDYVLAFKNHRKLKI